MLSSESWHWGVSGATLLLKIYMTSERAVKLALEKEFLQAIEASCQLDPRLTSSSYPAGCCPSPQAPFFPPEVVFPQGPQLPLRQLPDLFQGHTHPLLLFGFFLLPETAQHGNSADEKSGVNYC